MERLTEREAHWLGEEFWTSAREPDDEDPSCRTCDHISDSDKYCIDNCGGANAWNGYKRSERME